MRSSRRFRLGALLCIALLALFAGMNLSRTMDRIQHGAGRPHVHLLLSALSVEEAHDAVHDGSSRGSTGPADHIPDGSHHHHHGDAGSGLIPLAQSGIDARQPDHARHGIASARSEPGVAPQGQERPPRPRSIRV